MHMLGCISSHNPHLQNTNMCVHNPSQIYSHFRHKCFRVTLWSGAECTATLTLGRGATSYVFFMSSMLVIKKWQVSVDLKT